MELTDLKRWHWAILGAAAGAIMGFAWMGNEPAAGRNFTTPFLREVIGQTSDEAATKGWPVVKNVIVMRGEKDPNGNSVQRVLLSYLNHDRKTGKGIYLPGNVNAVASDLQATTVEEFIDNQAKLLQTAKDPGAAVATYSHPLSQNLPGYFGAWVGGGALLIGGVWGSLVNLIVGAGLVPKREAKPKARKYASGDIDDGTIKDAKRHGMTAADKEELDAVVAAYASKNPTGDHARHDGKAATTTAGPAIKKLEAGPLEQPAQPEKKPEEPVHYGGEWYPVVRPAHHENKP
ncbi:MAG: hypothetical protein QM770_09130 [Tepidisphaeraceae bacterium]